LQIAFSPAFTVYLSGRGPLRQWHRSVVNMGVRPSVRSSHQTVSDYTLRQWFPNTQQSRFLAACRRLETLVLPSVFEQVFHPWWCETCRVIQQQF